MYPAVISLIEIALTNWTSFDGWCLSRGVDPLELPSRRFINSIWNWLTESMDDETTNKLIDVLYQTSYQRPKIKRESQDETEPKRAILPDPKQKWRAPEGWTPPGWIDDATAYNNAMAFIDSKNSNFTG